MKIYKNILEHKIGDDLVLINSDSKKIFTINRTGIYIWNLIKKGNDEEKIKIKISKKYRISEDIANKDLTAFIKKLKKYNILEKK